MCDAHDARARAIVASEARARVAWYALEGDDTGDVTPTGSAAPAAPLAGGGAAVRSLRGRRLVRALRAARPGHHNVRNAVAAIAACAEGFGASVQRAARRTSRRSRGCGGGRTCSASPRGVRVYDDFAHHPTAVDETLRALRARHPDGALWVAFEPRSATACRALHQEAYARAFDAADHVLLAPLGRTNVPAAERLDLERLARDLGGKARAMPGVDAIVERLAARRGPATRSRSSRTARSAASTRKLLDALGRSK